MHVRAACNVDYTRESKLSEPVRIVSNIIAGSPAALLPFDCRSAHPGARYSCLQGPIRYSMLLKVMRNTK